jgi:alcohol dehydrogenase class IV
MRALAKDISYDIHRVFDFRTVGMQYPNRIIFGCGAIDKIGEEAAQLGKGRALIISDEILEMIGTVSQVKDRLESAGFEVAIFAGVEPEPHLETAEKIFIDHKDDEISVIIGLGGGSVMDITKFSAQCLAHKVTPRSIASGEYIPDSRGIPMILVPTTSGTGSEVSPIFVVTVDGDKWFLNNPYLYSDISIVDPELTISMPPNVTATTGLDALTHAIEAMMHKNATPLTDILCLGGIELAGAYLRRAYADGEDLEARYYMSLAATFSMMGMGMSGGLYAHSVAFIVGKYKPTPHGLGCALGLPYLMAYNLPVCSEKLARIADALGESTTTLNELDAARRSVQSIFCLMEGVGIPTTLQEYGGVLETDIENAADLMLKLYPRPFNPRAMGPEDAVQYWRDMWYGFF